MRSDDFDEDQPIFQNTPPLSPTSSTTQLSTSTGLCPEPLSTIVNQARFRPHNDPGNAILLDNLGPNTRLLDDRRDSFDSSIEGTSSYQHSAIDRMEASRPEEQAFAAKLASVSVKPLDSPDSVEGNLDLARAARQAITESETKDLSSRTRVDSAQDSEKSKTPDQPTTGSESMTHSGPGRLPDSQFPPPPLPPSTTSISPTLRKHTIQPTESTNNTLPAVQPTSPSRDGMAGSPPQNERLPSFRQLTGQLDELAEAAATQEARVPPFTSHQHTQSFGSTTSQSPRIPYNTFAGNVQASPVNPYPYGAARSPTTTTAEAGGQQHYGSPPQYTTKAYFNDRRASTVADASIQSFPPSLPTASSSGDSQGQTASSSGDGYSTTHTTPIDQPPSAPTTDASSINQRPILPPPPGMPSSAVVLNAGFKCDYPDCNAPPFQTQYLLTSHRNVHSQNRPHYCPVADCPRSEGGKGFKRKNEMIRHGLVHNSPGYICPFCPDREHKYPRPDNLQRHVRVHHVDKDRDDEALRQVLSQRIEGAGKSRRRRTNTGTSSGGSTGGPPPVFTDGGGGGGAAANSTAGGGPTGAGSQFGPMG